MLRNEASIRELFYRSCIADRSFVPQDDRKIGYVMGRYEGSIGELFYRSCIAVDPSCLRMTRKLDMSWVVTTRRNKKARLPLLAASLFIGYYCFYILTFTMRYFA